ncbi:hypothetical protein A5759_02900 [Mycobacterium sp. 852014-52144_SCH5372336]|nr:hypothetical protein A5759_02900 [Mycobacterium sp. 852014-52144_SCH5372336]
MNERCEVEWLPPPELDTGQARLNYYHRPERLLRPPDEQGTRSHNGTAVSPAPDEVSQPGDRQSSAAPPAPTDDSELGDRQSSAASPVNGAGEPGGPAPPGDWVA